MYLFYFNVRKNIELIVRIYPSINFVKLFYWESRSHWISNDIRKVIVYDIPGYRKKEIPYENVHGKGETRVTAYGFALSYSEGEVRMVWKWWKSFLRHCQSPPPVRITLHSLPVFLFRLAQPYLSSSSPCTDELGGLYPS